MPEFCIRLKIFKPGKDMRLNMLSIRDVNKVKASVIESINNTNKDKLKSGINRIISSIYEWIEAALYSLVCVVLAFIFVFRIVAVDGPSMVPTLNDKEKLILLTFMLSLHGDIVVIRPIYAGTAGKTGYSCGRG